MGEKNCDYCPEEAYYYCKCINPNAKFCKQHLTNHENLLGNHMICVFHISDRLVNPITKNQIINRIKDIRQKAVIQKNLAKNKYLQDIALLAEYLQEGNDQLTEFIKQCNNILKEIIQIEKISDKEFYIPLENALISKNIDSLLKSIKCPKLKISTSIEFEYIPTVFPYCLYNYSDQTIGYELINKIKVYPLNKEIQNPRLN